SRGATGAIRRSIDASASVSGVSRTIRWDVSCVSTIALYVGVPDRAGQASRWCGLDAADPTWRMNGVERDRDGRNHHQPARIEMPTAGAARPQGTLTVGGR